MNCWNQCNGNDGRIQLFSCNNLWFLIYLEVKLEIQLHIEDKDNNKSTLEDVHLGLIFFVKIRLIREVSTNCIYFKKNL